MSNSGRRIHRDPPTCQVEHQPRQLPNGTCDYGICHTRSVITATRPTFPTLESHILPQITPDCCRQHQSSITVSADKDPQGQDQDQDYYKQQEQERPAVQSTSHVQTHPPSPSQSAKMFVGPSSSRPRTTAHESGRNMDFPPTKTQNASFKRGHYHLSRRDRRDTLLCTTQMSRRKAPSYTFPRPRIANYRNGRL